MIELRDWYLTHGEDEDNKTVISACIFGSNKFKDGTKVTVSDVQTFDRGRGIVQTSNTIYALGNPLREWVWYAESRGFGVEDEIKCLFGE